MQYLGTLVVNFHLEKATDVRIVLHYYSQNHSAKYLAAKQKLVQIRVLDNLKCTSLPREGRWPNCYIPSTNRATFSSRLDACAKKGGTRKRYVIFQNRNIRYTLYYVHEYTLFAISKHSYAHYVLQFCRYILEKTLAARIERLALFSVESFSSVLSLTKLT